jgi:two-component system chemotaxis response regulator CheB
MEENGIKALLIGGSAGSLDVILDVLPALRPDLPFALIIILHRMSGADSALVELLQDRSPLPVQEAEEKESILPGNIYIAPANYHLLIEQDHSFSLDYSERVHYCRPSIDLSFQSAADAYGSRLACILLSGANADGAEGMATIAESKGKIAVQDPHTADVSYMPQQGLLRNKSSEVLKKDEIAAYVNSLR